MKVLVVAAYNKGYFAPFVEEQVSSLRELGNDIDYFGIIGKGVVGYLWNRKKLLQKIKEFKPDIIHAHYGLSGLLANLQRRIPVITTYHGSDINDEKVLPFSRLCMRLSRHNIFVSNKTINKSGIKERYSLIPCGVDINRFSPFEKQTARKALNLEGDNYFVLFSGAFDNKVKNSGLALKAIKQLTNVHLLEYKGYSREQAPYLINAVNALLLTSFSEGSPQVIKEAMACNCPIVATDVGDVSWLLDDEPGCFLADFEPEDIAERLKRALIFTEKFGKTKARQRLIMLGLDSKSVALRINKLYTQVGNGK